MSVKASKFPNYMRVRRKSNLKRIGKRIAELFEEMTFSPPIKESSILEKRQENPK